jgi:hypothetical protein
MVSASSSPDRQLADAPCALGLGAQWDRVRHDQLIERDFEIRCTAPPDNTGWVM